MRFTNEVVKKEFSKIKNYLWIGVLLIILSFVFLSLGDKRDSMDKKDSLNMHNLIVDNLKDKTGKTGFINANNIPYKFAVYKDTTDAYYFVTDDKYIYVVYMDSDTFNSLNNKKIEKKAKKIIGITKETPDDIKKLAVSSYNEIVGNQNKITIDDYDDYFGSIYLDMTSSNSGFYYLMFIAFLLVGFILLIIYVASNSKFKKGIKKLSDEELKKIDFLYLQISGWCTCCLLCLSQPFMKLWMGTDMLLSPLSVLFMCIYFYMLKVGDVRSIYYSTTGMWWEMRYRSIVETVANLILNIVLGYLFGINGIILATVISLFLFNFLWGASIVFKNYFGLGKLKSYFLYHLKYFVITIVICSVTWMITLNIELTSDYANLVVKGIVCLIIPTLLYFLVYGRTNICKNAIQMIKGTRRF